MFSIWPRRAISATLSSFGSSIGSSPAPRSRPPALVRSADDDGHPEAVVGGRACPVGNGTVEYHHAVGTEADAVEHALALVLVVQQQIAVGVLADVDQDRYLVLGIARTVDVDRRILP